MIAYVLKRILYIAVILAVMSVLIFLITQIMPGNVAKMIAGQFAPEEVVQALEDKLGLHDPLYVQYWRWASSFLTGELGESLVMERPIGPVIGLALKRSAVLAGLSIVFVSVIGIGLGVIAAVRHNRPVDHGISVFTYFGISVPEFFWGIVLIILFARYIRVLPTGGYAEISQGVWPWVQHLILPTATLTFTLIAHVSRLTRSSMLETLQSPYIRNARAKGLPERVILLRHALRNALLPTITVIAIDVGWLIGGIVVVESVFSFPGMGRLLVWSIQYRDLPLIQASILIVSAIYCVSNLVADLLYAFFNPKIRYGRTRT